MDKVLAEIQRRIALVKRATPGPWIFNPNESESIYASVDLALERFPGMKKLYVASATYFGSSRPPGEAVRNGEFIADCGTHRARELEFIEHVVRETIEDDCTCAKMSMRNVTCSRCAMLARIERMILGEEG